MSNPPARDRPPSENRRRREIGADDIPDALWKELESSFPKYQETIRLVRSRLIDGRSDAINAGTALTLLTALGSAGIADNPAIRKLTELLEEVISVHEGILTNLQCLEPLQAYIKIPSMDSMQELFDTSFQKIFRTTNSFDAAIFKAGDTIIILQKGGVQYVWTGNGPPDQSDTQPSGKWIPIKLMSAKEVDTPPGR